MKFVKTFITPKVFDGPVSSTKADKISVLVSETKVPNYMYCQFRHELNCIALQERHCTMALYVICIMMTYDIINNCTGTKRKVLSYV